MSEAARPSGHDETSHPPARRAAAEWLGALNASLTLRLAGWPDLPLGAEPKPLGRARPA